ncbi:MAG: adenylate/guanylate cyclase domain-containing protein, partial [Bacteroidales bacterium]|nr:adenylate/guanylate cyclase domain-containing protein [Bacteroidales bacterium]
MSPTQNKYSKVPRYHGLRIYLVSTFLYFFLVFPVAGILLFKYVPDYRIKNRIESIPKEDVSKTDKSFLKIEEREDDGSVIVKDFEANKQIGGTMALLIRLLIVSFVLGLGFNLPFKLYFRKKRKCRVIKPGLVNFCKKFLLKSPLINAGILAISYGITILYMLYIITIRPEVDELSHRFYLQFFFITLLSSILTLMLVYFWMKHRVHIWYIGHIFSQEELRKRIFKANAGKIRNRLWISSAMTTLIPLIIVVFYLVLSITTVKELELSEMTDDHWKILLGKYQSMDISISEQVIGDLFYVNTINSLLMVLGIGTGILVALIYIVLFVRWTTEDIVRPVNELLASMRLTGQGELDSFCTVRTNDEIGLLTEGYNEMSEKIKSYFLSMENINRANSRFVPKQFLDFLGKENITEIQLGDQVQKEMTILFSDIRDFTALSETMSPKENFNFINNYLGYMEPVIRNNNGFIDKFMGDSIMALFPDKSEDAINAAIEMKIKLMEYNEIMSQFGKPSIDAGIGIHTGLLMLGIIGGEGRMDGTVISDAVNLAARLEGLTKIYGSSIIITEDTLIKLSDPSQYHFRFLDIVKVKRSE